MPVAAATTTRITSASICLVLRVGQVWTAGRKLDPPAVLLRRLFQRRLPLRPQPRRSPLPAPEPQKSRAVWKVSTGAEWSKRELTVEWPPDYEHKKVSLLRHVVFVEPNVAFALIVHWKQEPTFAPANVGLVRTTDNGAHWLHVNVFDGPDIGDINERHMLTLEVE